MRLTRAIVPMIAAIAMAAFAAASMAADADDPATVEDVVVPPTLAGGPVVLTAPEEDRVADAAARVRPSLEMQLKRKGLRWGAPMLIQVFKEESHLEVWIDDGSRYQLLRRYAICHWSGALGPKLRQGDQQAPEGFYGIRRSGLNPRSIAHLSMDLGFPNAYDRAHGRTGDFLMVHGHCISLGCYAIGDAAIEEIYTLAVAAFDAGQAEIPVLAFPFRFDLRQEVGWAASPWADFWRELRAGHEAFARTGRPPHVDVSGGRYVVSDAATPVAAP